MRSKMKTYHVNMLKKYISREPEGKKNVVPVDATGGATVAIAGVVHQDVDLELRKALDPEGDQREDPKRRDPGCQARRGCTKYITGLVPDVP